MSFWCSQFFQKTNEKFLSQQARASIEFSSSFFGRIDGIKKTFIMYHFRKLSSKKNGFVLVESIKSTKMESFLLEIQQTNPLLWSTIIQKFVHFSTFVDIMLPDFALMEVKGVPTSKPAYLFTIIFETCNIFVFFMHLSNQVQSLVVIIFGIKSKVKKI